MVRYILVWGCLDVFQISFLITELMVELLTELGGNRKNTLFSWKGKR